VPWARCACAAAALAQSCAGGACHAPAQASAAAVVQLHAELER
jgi:hypothetical protein